MANSLNIYIKTSAFLETQKFLFLLSDFDTQDTKCRMGRAKPTVNQKKDSS